MILNYVHSLWAMAMRDERSRSWRSSPAITDLNANLLHSELLTLFKCTSLRHQDTSLTRCSLRWCWQLFGQTSKELNRKNGLYAAKWKQFIMLWSSQQQQARAGRHILQFKFKSNSLLAGVNTQTGLYAFILHWCNETSHCVTVIRFKFSSTIHLSLLISRILS